MKFIWQKILKYGFIGLTFVSCASLPQGNNRGPNTAALVHPVTGYPLSEPLVQGCQDLSAKPVTPIHLRGKILATYLPDGRHYNKLSEGPPSGPDHFELGVLDLNKPGTPIKRLTTNEIHDAEVTASSNGRKIVWSQRPKLDYFEGSNSILVANLDTTQQRVVAHANNEYMGLPSFFTPDNDKVIFSRQGANDSAPKLQVFDLKTGKLYTFKTTFKGGIADPQMSPDGKKLVFKSYGKDPEIVHIYTVNRDGTGAKQWTNKDFRDEDPAISPDGKILAFERMYGGTDHKAQHANDYFFQEGIVAIDMTTGVERPLTEPDVCGKNELWLPTWSPDGEFIMFTRGLHMENGDFTHDLWVMRKDGSDLQRVPNSEGIMFFDWVY